ncbi:23S rRNA (guanosine(2251)-2'-O)-methyltransferase RlmB [Portibacter lacus]|uniref:23S rRNA (Guanosine(2251)-2'-O)-methyltransferase RlmB n=1 Tax=Portibacter lacus TaxID=1099794 RepID=A0AA37SN36_9BACT|nr:23S rRNA (guanosine(2251)-2'-O)-methyltransferase RlmB [Portibacter lacus]GLR17798.1 23S rRNA (guanosine(2251)-2'-O)-methyltransferase RlmB [Portibacter lacus]
MADSDDIIFGRNPVIEAIQANKEIDKVLILKTIRGPFEKDVRKLCKELDIPLQYVPSHKLDKITRKNHQGIIAFASLVEYQTIENLIPHLYEKGESPIIVILDGVTDVRNFGAIARSAEVFGVHGMVIGEKNSARINHDAFKTSAGAILRIPICREKSLSNTVEYLRSSGFQIFATDLNTDHYISDINFNQPCAIIMGSEGDGVSSNLLQLCDEKFKIPQVGETDSLNVSVASGVIMYEVLKQRTSK